MAAELRNGMPLRLASKRSNVVDEVIVIDVAQAETVLVPRFGPAGSPADKRMFTVCKVGQHFTARHRPTRLTLFYNRGKARSFFFIGASAVEKSAEAAKVAS